MARDVAGSAANSVPSEAIAARTIAAREAIAPVATPKENLKVETKTAARVVAVATEQGARTARRKALPLTLLKNATSCLQQLQKLKSADQRAKVQTAVSVAHVVLSARAQGQMANCEARVANAVAKTSLPQVQTTSQSKVVYRLTQRARRRPMRAARVSVGHAIATVAIADRARLKPQRWKPPAKRRSPR